MFLEQEVGLSVATAYAYSFGVIGEVDDSVFDPFEVFCLAVFFVEHPVFPADAGRSAEGS